MQVLSRAGANRSRKQRGRKAGRASVRPGSGDRRRDHVAQRAVRRIRAAGRGREAQALLAAARPPSRRRHAGKGPCPARPAASGEAILAGIGRYGAYVQHGKTYANLGRDDDVLEIGGNRAIDLIVAKESGAGAARFGGSSGRELGEHSEGGKVSVKAGRFGAYVNHGKINATIPKGTDPASLTLADALELLRAKAAGG